MGGKTLDKEAQKLFAHFEEVVERTKSANGIKLKFKCPVCGTALEDLRKLREMVIEYGEAMDKHPNDAYQWGLFETMIKEAKKEVV